MMKRGKKKLMSDGTRGTLHERTQPKPSTGPEVGIFWFTDGSLLIDHTPLSEAEPYGDFLIHPHGHDRVWQRYQRNGIVPRGIEYEEALSGKVMYKTRTRQFTMLADPCILKRKELVTTIKKEMNLPRSTKLGEDSHYRCFACLRGQSD